MVLKHSLITTRLKELDGVLQELSRYPHEQVWESYQKGMMVFPRSAQEVLAWLERQG